MIAKKTLKASLKALKDFAKKRLPDETLQELDARDECPLEVVRLCERMGGRPFSVEHVSEKALRAEMQAAPDQVLQSLRALRIACAKGDRIDMKETLRAVPVQLTPVHDHVNRLLAAAGVTVKTDGAGGHTSL